MSFEDEDYDEAALEKHERRITRCSAAGCRARIVFLRNDASGKNVPCDADTVEPDDDHYNGSRHVSHYKTCTDPKRFSKGRQ